MTNRVVGYFENWAQYRQSGGNPASPLVNCQDRSLPDQLNHGIRYVDIRCRRTQNVFVIHHDSYYMHFNFGAGVRDVCIDFLKANPSECIVMQIKHEFTHDNATQSFQQVLDGYVQGFENFFYLDDPIPTLGEVRGKIVVVRRFDLDGSSPRGLSPLTWVDNASFKVKYSAGNKDTVMFEVQDQYQVPTILVFSIDPKWNAISTLLDRAKSDLSDTWHINFASGTSSGAYPNAVADRINPRVSDYLGGASYPDRLGTLMIDFPDDNLIGKIISPNIPPAATSSRVVHHQAA